MKAVREYQARYPDKAVTYYADMNCPSGRDGWAVLIGGGSLPDVKLPAKLSEAIPTMQPADDVVSGPRPMVPEQSNGDYFIYSENTDGKIRIALPIQAGAYRQIGSTETRVKSSLPRTSQTAAQPTFATSQMSCGSSACQVIEH